MAKAPKKRSQTTMPSTRKRPVTEHAPAGRDRRRLASRYRVAFVRVVRAMAEAGAVEQEMADALGVDLWTFRQWRSRHPALGEALRIGKAAADERVERSLYQRAVGYTVEAVKIFLPPGAGEPVYAPYREWVHPDVTAQIFWLKNRRSKEWRDKHDIELDVTVERIERVVIDAVPELRQLEDVSTGDT